MSKKKLTQKRLKELLDYDPETGVFIRIKTIGNMGCYKKGSQAGKTGNYIQIEHRAYIKSKLAFLFMTGSFPDRHIKFMDNNKFNTKWANLYETPLYHQKITQKFSKEILKYDPETGIFVWLRTASTRVKNGDVAGRISKSTGYRDISICGVRVHASRLANLYMLGYLPEHEMDHRNRIRCDDRWCNIRHVTHSCNVRNTGLSSRNKTGVIGVCWCKERKKWKTQLAINKKQIVNKRFDSFDDAVMCRWEAEKKYDWNSCNSYSTSRLYLKKRGLI